MKIHAITIDLWGTLLLDGPGSDDRYKRRRVADFEQILKDQGITVRPGALDAAYEKSMSWLGGMWRKNRDVPVQGHVRAILEAADSKMPAKLSRETMAELVEAYARPALLVPPAVDPTALGALQQLRASGYTLALVSNTMRTPGVTLRQVLDRFGLLAHLEATTFSDEVGVRKPDADIFHQTLGMIGASPEHAVHVGDDPILDVKGARDAGMRAVQVTGSSRWPLGGRAPDAVISDLSKLPGAIASLDR